MHISFFSPILLWEDCQKTVRRSLCWTLGWPDNTPPPPARSDPPELPQGLGAPSDMHPSMPIKTKYSTSRSIIQYLLICTDISIFVIFFQWFQRKTFIFAGNGSTWWPLVSVLHAGGVPSWSVAMEKDQRQGASWPDEGEIWPHANVEKHAARI